MPGNSLTAFKTPQAERPASLIYFNYGNSRTKLLVQETLKLSKGMQDYACSVLLKAENLPSWAVLSKNDEQLADIVDVPTKTSLFKYIVQLAEDGYYIDLFLFTHGWKHQFGQQPAELGSEQRVSAGDISSRLSPAATGFTAMPIRIVWGTNSYGSTLGDSWRAIGAKAWSGARAVDYYPNRWANFIDDWNRGTVSFDAAVCDADTAAVRTVAQTFIALVDAPAQKQAGTWGGCRNLTTVLGDDECAQDYFMSCWLDRGDWLAGKSGKQNMNHSAYHIRGGEKSITKYTRPHWPAPGSSRQPVTHAS